jgi:hypothetical protein
VLLPSGALAAVWFGVPASNPVQQSVAAEVSHAVPPANGSPAKPFATGNAVQAAPVTESAPPVAAPPPVQAHHARRHEGPAPVVEAAPPRVDLPQAAAAFPAESTLAAENALLQSAMIAARSGDAARAVDLLDHLLTRYPSSPLAQSARAQRVRVAARLRADELSTSLVPPSP